MTTRDLEQGRSGKSSPAGAARAVSLDSRSAIARVDRKGMLDLVAGFPGQIGEALELGQRAAIGVAQGPFRAVVVAGMGGSAMGGDILRCALGDVLEIPLFTVRGYHLPHMVGPGWLVLCSSYSGNTEETIALYEDARRRRARVICLTAGGRLAEKSSRDGVPWIKLPGGMPPRAALAYSFIPMLTTLWRLDAAPPRWHELDDLVHRVREAGERCAVEVPTQDNIAKQLARKLVDRLIVIHASADHLEAVALRWRSQFEENAKQLAFHSLYPELDHNEVVGWAGGGAVAENAHVIALRDPEDDPRLKRRIEVTSEIIASSGVQVSQVWTGNGSRLARLVSLIHLGDWVSLYLAILRRVDPTPVTTIDEIKMRLEADGDVPRGAGEGHA